MRRCRHEWPPPLHTYTPAGTILPSSLPQSAGISLSLDDAEHAGTDLLMIAGPGSGNLSTVRAVNHFLITKRQDLLPIDS